MSNFTPYLVVWSLLALVVLFLAIYRKSLSSKEDDTLHLNSGAGTVMAQESLAAKLAVIDKWGKLLTVLTVLAGVALAGWYVYYVWTDSSRLITQ